MLQSSSKRLGKMTHKDDSDEHLREIVTRNLSAAAGMPNTEDGIIESYKLLGEAEACSELLSEREEKRERVRDAAEKWKRDLPGKKEGRFLRLKNAASPNGQLVAAILEDEDGKTAEELAGWCDELAEIPDEKFSELLEGLITEGFLEKDDKNRYHLLGICTEDPFLSPEAVEARLNRLYGEDNDEYNEKEKNTARWILYVLRDNGAPMSAQDCLDQMQDRSELPADLRFADMEDTSNEFEVRWRMNHLAKNGILCKEYSVDNKDYYWFAMLG